MINIIISVDYEIFGNGSGDFKEHMINPMDKILEICSKNSVSLSIMFEVMEYIAIKKYDSSLEKKLGYSPKKKIKRQINNAYQDGHDVQLHVHPQFRKMEFDGNKFRLNRNIKPYLELTEQEVEHLLKKGKKTLESVVEDTSYSCNTLRLSNIGWREVPENTIEPMRNLDLIAHSLSNKIPKNEKGYWKIKDKLYEIPIHSNSVNILNSISPRKLFTYLYVWLHTEFNIFDADEKDNSNKKMSETDMNYKWDLSKQSCREMLEYLEIGKKRYDYLNHEVPLVMIGHTKDFFNERNFKKFLANIREDKIKFSTFHEFIKKLNRGD